MEENVTLPVEKRPNGIGTAGFVCGLIGLCLCWIPVVGQIIGWILSTLGLIFSIIGIAKKNAKKGLSIAGLIISCITILILIIVVAAAGAALATAAEVL
ncbi:MAG: hypothetical protein MJZ70_02710 [Bacteroidales bacterium]|nr:hypothetical protein [Bacteroidales bacterium]